MRPRHVGRVRAQRKRSGSYGCKPTHDRRNLCGHPPSGRKPCASDGARRGSFLHGLLYRRATHGGRRYVADDRHRSERRRPLRGRRWRCVLDQRCRRAQTLRHDGDADQPNLWSLRHGGRTGVAGHSRRSRWNSRCCGGAGRRLCRADRRAGALPSLCGAGCNRVSFSAIAARSASKPRSCFGLRRNCR